MVGSDEENRHHRVNRPLLRERWRSRWAEECQIWWVDQEGKCKGWQTWSFPVEVGCRGFPAQSVWRLFSALGVTRRCRRTAAQKMGQAAEQSSCWIWLKKNTSSWKPINDAQWLIITVEPPSWMCTELGVETHDDGWPRLRTSEVLQQYQNCCM